MNEFRKTTQELLPLRHTPTAEGQYDIYPVFPVGEGQIHTGFSALAEMLTRHTTITFDGYVGVLWDDFQAKLDEALRANGLSVHWVNIADALKPEETINALVAPYLGGDDPIFGMRTELFLKDFFDLEKVAQLAPQSKADLNIIYGTGASLANWKGMLAYVDIPKNEIQFRSRAGSITNLGATQPRPPKVMYKRFFFVDWEILNVHKANLTARIDWIVDGQRPEEPVFMKGDQLRNSLKKMAHNYFRVRPWFEPGAWGGQWIKENIPQLPQDVPNYAWSFELIVPENGLILESNQILLEVSFDFLMYAEYKSVLGKWADVYQFEFPIRMDFLDTFEGGNLSIQVHPRPEYIRKHFGQSITQDETYYILDCEPGARVYLGFQEGVEPNQFQAALEKSQETKQKLDITQYVHSVPSHKHDLYLIPHGTIHGAGVDNLVLEISATTYIFTFKLYDWMRMDLDGKPRPINIERGMENLYFYRQGERVEQELIAQPQIIEKGQGYQVVHLPTHPAHAYDVHRLEFVDSITVDTGGSCHVMNLVEGRSVLLETENGLQTRFNYAETFVIPAAAGRYRLISPEGEAVKVLKVFFKENWSEDDWLSQISGIDSAA